MTAQITPERAIYDLPSLGSPKISPDGTRIAYVRSQVNKETNKNESQIWLCDIDGGNRRRLTWTGPVNANPVWSPDGNRLAYVSKRDGDHPLAICVLDFAGGESRIISRHSSGPSGLAWSPDGSTIAYAAAVDPDNPNETPRDPKAPAAVRVVSRIDYKQDGYGYLNDVRSQIFLVDSRGEGERRQITRELTDHGRPTWSPDGTQIAVSMPQLNGMVSQLGIIDVESHELRRIGPADGSIGLFSWSPDGTRILFDGDFNQSPHHDYYIATVDSGAIQRVTEDVVFLPDVGYQSGGAPGNPVWLDSDTALVHGLLRGASGIWTVDLREGPTLGALKEIGYWEAIHSGFSVSSDHKVIVQTTSDLDGTIGLASIDRKTGEKTLLFNETEAFFAESPAAQWEKISLDRAGFTIEGWLLKPANFDPRKRYPVILDVHGGPHNAYGYGINGLAEVFAAGEFLVLRSNPRGSGTYGRAFAEAVIGDWGNEDWKDLQAILDLVLERPYADKERTGIYGYSYGGYMTAWVIGQTDRFKAAICGAPVFDNESMFGTSDIGHRFNIEMGGLPWGEGREKLIACSPSTHIHNAKTPTLIVQGEADERCPIGQGEQMFISLKKLGVEVEFARYPGGAHHMIVDGEPAHRLDYYTRTLGWFKDHLGDPAD